MNSSHIILFDYWTSESGCPTETTTHLKLDHWAPPHSWLSNGRSERPCMPLAQLESGKSGGYVFSSLARAKVPLGQIAVHGLGAWSCFAQLGDSFDCPWDWLPTSRTQSSNNMCVVHPGSTISAPYPSNSKAPDYEFSIKDTDTLNDWRSGDILIGSLAPLQSKLVIFHFHIGPTVCLGLGDDDRAWTITQSAL
jgi:hypothetical protein